MHARSRNNGLSRKAAIADVQSVNLFQPEEILAERYIPLSVLGTGGYGTVFLAWDEQLQRRVAIKEITLGSSRSAQNAEAIDRALEEARTAAMLSHPNIVTVYDFLSTPDSAYIIMEHIEGIKLSELDDDALNDDVIASVVKSIAAALTFAHKNGVHHLDIKPSNTLINSEGHIKIIDFGISKLSGISGTAMAEAGTLGYMPLEQLRGEECSAKTDQWAFAALVYELLTLEIPYENEFKFGGDFDEMLNLQSHSGPELLLTGDEDLDEALSIALSPDPDERFSSVKKFADRLLRSLGNSSEGKKQLAEEVTYIISDDPDNPHVQARLQEEAEEEALKASARTALSAWNAIGRLGLAVFCYLASAHLFSFLGFGQMSDPTIGLAALAAALIIGISPVLGSAILILIYGIALLMKSQLIAGVVVLLLGTLWWGLVGRKSTIVSGLVALGLMAAMEMNFSSLDWLISMRPDIFEEKLLLLNLALLLCLILLSALGSYLLHRKELRDT